MVFKRHGFTQRRREIMISKRRGFTHRGFVQAGLPIRCRDIIERIAVKRYVCPREVDLLIDKIALKWGVDSSYITQHAFDNTYASRYNRDGIGGDYNEGCIVKSCYYSRSFKYTEAYKNRETRCIICHKTNILDCKRQIEIEDLHLEKKKGYCESVKKGYGICIDILDAVDPYRQRTWNHVRYKDLDFENQGVFLISKFLLKKAEKILRKRREK